MVASTGLRHPIQRMFTLRMPLVSTEAILILQEATHGLMDSLYALFARLSSVHKHEMQDI